jgi:hypothetical protein
MSEIPQLGDAVSEYSLALLSSSWLSRCVNSIMVILRSRSLRMGYHGTRRKFSGYIGIERLLSRWAVHHAQQAGEVKLYRIHETAADLSTSIHAQSLAVERCKTMLILIGVSPASRAASIPARVRLRLPPRVTFANRFSSKESSEMLTRFRPAAFRLQAI